MSFSATDRDVRLRDGGKPLWEKTNVRGKKPGARLAPARARCVGSGWVVSGME